MAIEVPSVFELGGEVIDAKGMRWAATHPALTPYFTDKVMRWLADAMQEAEEDTVVVLDSE